MRRKLLLLLTLFSVWFTPVGLFAGSLLKNIWKSQLFASLKSHEELQFSIKESMRKSKPVPSKLQIL
jgi:hypothetical protein